MSVIARSGTSCGSLLDYWKYNYLHQTLFEVQLTVGLSGSLNVWWCPSVKAQVGCVQVPLLPQHCQVGCRTAEAPPVWSGNRLRRHGPVESGCEGSVHEGEFKGTTNVPTAWTPTGLSQWLTLPTHFLSATYSLHNTHWVFCSHIELLCMNCAI